jgi:hypothetical protein
MSEIENIFIFFTIILQMKKEKLQRRKQELKSIGNE